MNNLSKESYSEEEKEVPTLEELLVSLSTAARNITGNRDIELRNTIRALITRESLDGVARGEYARLVILLGFKRRNHSKSQANGDGDGERGFLRSILLELYDLVGEGGDNNQLGELVNAVLPLVPHYGSWRDLLVLGEGSFPVESTTDGESEVEICLPPLGQAVGRVFATQLRRDMSVVVANENLLEEDREKNSIPPSNACKYAPHEKRHTGNTTVKEGQVKAKKGKNLLRANRIQRLLADEVATLVLEQAGADRQPRNPRLRADYRKFLSKLKAILTTKGFVIEPLLCKRNLEAINFKSANKGSLAKNRKCLEKDPAIKSKWNKAMMSSSTAVADIDSLLEAARNITEENKEIEDPGDRMSSLRVMKCIERFENSRQELQGNAAALLEQVATSTGVEENIDAGALAQSMSVHVLAVVDSSACDSEEEFICLILAAYVTARAQGLSHVVVDGAIMCLPPRVTAAALDVPTGSETVSASSRRAEALALREAEALETSRFFENACRLATEMFHRGANVDGDAVQLGFNVDSMLEVRRLPLLDRLRLNTQKALENHGSGGGGGDGEKEDLPVDVVYLTSSDLAREVTDAESYREFIEALQLQQAGAPLRTFSLCRVSESMFSAESERPLVLRNLPANPNPAELSLDLCLVMDLTGSMGSWMDAAKTHLTDIVAGLQKETKVGKIRVSYVGYRDWQDQGRLVSQDFVPIASAETVLALMRNQHPSGGNDLEEDVLIAFHAVLTDLTWESNLRIMLHLADAPAHGYGSSVGGDRFKNGRCPDQKAPHLSLPETLTKLAYDKNVDLLFCRLNSYGITNAMEKMFSEVYDDGPGFGILPMTQGAKKFKDAILSTLSTSMLQAMAPADIAGLQSFSGGTASSLLRVMNSSLRESLSHYEGEKDDNDGVGLEGVTCSIEVDEEEEEEDEKHSGGTSKSARSTFERLLSELEADELQPVRMALGMTLKQSMQAEAASVLLAAGVTVQDLVDKQYPADVIQAIRAEGLKKVGQL